MKEWLELRNKVVIVTGGSPGKKQGAAHKKVPNSYRELFCEAVKFISIMEVHHGKNN